MRKVAMLGVALAGLLLASGCGQNGRVIAPGEQPLAATLTPPASPLLPGVDTSWSVNISSGIAPYTVVWDFGGGGNPNTITQTNQGPTATASTQLRAGNWTATASISDSGGLTLTKMQAYTVLPNHPPVATASFDAATSQVTLTATDPDPGQLLTITLTPPPGISLSVLTRSGPSPLSATFDAAASDLFAGGSGNVGLSYSDGVDTIQLSGGVNVTIPAIGPPGADTLLAIPLQSTTARGDAVTVVVASMVPANPFRYMSGVGLTLDSDAQYVPGSFNVGAPGGAAMAADGFWAGMAPGSFSETGAPLPLPVDIGGGRVRFDFSLHPVGGSSQTTASGALFNAQFTFSTAGTKTFGFQQTDVNSVKRTYYSDDTTEHFWGSISNDGGSAIPHAVVIQ